MSQSCHDQIIYSESNLFKFFFSVLGILMSPKFSSLVDFVLVHFDMSHKNNIHHISLTTLT